MIPVIAIHLPAPATTANNKNMRGGPKTYLQLSISCSWAELLRLRPARDGLSGSVCEQWGCRSGCATRTARASAAPATSASGSCAVSPWSTRSRPPEVTPGFSKSTLLKQIFLHNFQLKCTIIRFFPPASLIVVPNFLAEAKSTHTCKQKLLCCLFVES